MRPKPIHIILSTACLLAVVVSIPVGLYVLQNKQVVLQSKLVQRVIPVYHSLRKIPDVFFMPSHIFTESTLPKYEVFISDKQLQKLNGRLGGHPFGSLLEEENKVWVDAQFRAGEYSDNVKIKYRGQLANHWNSYKKSYTIKFPKDNLFQGMRELSLIIPVDRGYFSASLNNQRLRNMEQVVRDEYYVQLSVNGSADGAMLASEHWSQAWIEKQPLSALSGIYGLDTYTGTSSMFSKEALPFWKSWNQDGEAFPAVNALVNLVQHASDEEFQRIAPTLVDLESFYAKDTTLLLTGGYHSSDDGNNIVLLFDATEGRFKTIPYNGGISSSEYVFSHNAPLLEERIWNIPEFMEARDVYFHKYVENFGKQDMEFLDAWITKMKPEFYRDNAKLENNFMFKKSITDFRDAAQTHLSIDPSVLATTSKVHTATSIEVPLTFSEEFSHLPLASLSTEEFVAAHPQFRLQNGSIVLSEGSYTFAQTLIIPRNTELIIEAGTTLALGDEVSIISYSPITMIGTSQKPIKVRPREEENPWGSLVALNTEDAVSTFDYVSLTGGSEARLQGVWFSGMLALHNANVVIDNSTITNVHGEDGINVKGGFVSLTNTLVTDTLSDGLDLDYVADESVISHNTFRDIGGDAIDISWTNAHITNNTVSVCTDKGISAGEQSKTTLLGNKVTGCDIGVAVKDKSEVILIENNISNTRLGVTLYQKKEFFGGGVATLIDTTITNTTIPTSADPQSTLIQ